MSITNEYTLNAVKCPSQTYGQITSGRLNPMQGIETERSAACPWPNFASQLTGEPEATFTTTQLNTLFGALGSGFLGISGNIDVELRRVQSLGGRVSTSTTSHIRSRATGGLMLIDSIRAAVGQRAEADCRIKFVYDGTNPILTTTGSVAVTAASGATEQFTLGKVTIGGSPITSIIEATLNFNWNLIVERADGDVMPTFVAIHEFSPELTLRGVNADLLATYGVDPTSIASAVLYLRKRAANGLMVADGTGEHLSITFGGGGLLRVDEVPFGGNDRAIPSIKLSIVNSSPSLYVGTALATAQTIS